jgi:hypothetical protein
MDIHRETKVGIVAVSDKQLELEAQGTNHEEHGTAPEVK